MFRKKSEEGIEVERTKRWGTFNDTLLKMDFGTYVGSSLPDYFRLEFDAIESPQWKSAAGGSAAAARGLSAPATRGPPATSCRHQTPAGAKSSVRRSRTSTQQKQTQ
jgi:hypothetical protein